MSFYDSDLKFEFARAGNEHGTHGPGDAYFFNTDLYEDDAQQYALSPFLNIGPLNMAYPIDATEGELENDTEIVKRLTFQVGTLRYPTNPDPLLLKFSDPFMLMDFNTADLYTRKKSAGEWEGLYPQYERAYAGDGSWEDDAETIRPVKGTPFRIRKIPICVERTGASETEGDCDCKVLQGYYYTLATAPFIITSDDEASTEEGYLGEWDPDDPKSVQLIATQKDCELGGGAGLPKITGEDCIETYVKEINGEDYVVVTDKYEFEVYPDECSSGALEIIQSESDCTIQFKLSCPETGDFLTSGDVSGIVEGMISGLSGRIEECCTGDSLSGISGIISGITSGIISGYVEERISGLSGRLEECCTGKLDVTLSGLSGIISGMISGATGIVDPSRLCITGDDTGCIETRIEDDCIVIKDKTTYVGGNWIDITKNDCQYTFDTNSTEVYNWLINNNFFPNSKPVVGGDCTEVWEVEVGGVDVYQVQGPCIEVDGCITANVVAGQPNNNLPPEVQLYVPCVTGTGCIQTSQREIDGKKFHFISGAACAFVTGTGCAHTYEKEIDGQTYTVVSGECPTLVTGTGCVETYEQEIDGKTYTVVSGECPTLVTGTGCVETYEQEIDGKNYTVVSGECPTLVTGTGCAYTYEQEIDGKNYTVVSGKCPTLFTGTGCVHTYEQEIDGDLYTVISGECGGGGTGSLVTGEDCIETYISNIGGKDYTVVKNNNTFTEGYGITITKTDCDYEFSISTSYQNYVNNYFTDLENRIDTLGVATGITGSGCIDVSIEYIDDKYYTVVSTPCLTGTGCIEVYQEEIDGKKYNVISGISCGGSGGLVTGTGCIETYDQEINGETYTVISGTNCDEISSCAGGAGANNFSVNFAEAGATGTEGQKKFFGGRTVVNGGIYQETQATNLIHDTYYVTDRDSNDDLGPPSAPEWNTNLQVCEGDIFTSPASYDYYGICYKVIDETWANNNSDICPECDVLAHHSSPDIGNKGDGWEVVECCPECSTAANNFTQFKSITGSGLIGTYETTMPYNDQYGDKLSDTPYIAITGHPCLLTGCNYSPIQIDLCSGGETITIEVLGRVL